MALRIAVDVLLVVEAVMSSLGDRSLAAGLCKRSHLIAVLGVAW